MSEEVKGILDMSLDKDKTHSRPETLAERDLIRMNKQQKVDLLLRGIFRFL